ncbi:site-specific integrase [Polaromonas hydrogenivorans]|uniref:Site-specific integrase n=1 Tax=Polaromonas hydrogenivorans TaxID=335476 RepID=A0AAU7M070_9BURK
MLDVTAVDPGAFFASWQAARLVRTDLKPMGAAGLTQASLVWRHWLAFCTVHGVAWDAARSVDIATFCQAISPRSSVKKTSPVTRRRYWRVLRDLYDHALASRLVECNPAEGAQPPATERVPSLALSPPMWAALHDGLHDGFPGGDDFKARRNRLALLLMMRAALTVREIIGLTLDCARPCTESPESPAGSGLLYLLRVRKAGGGHERVLQLDPETSRALHAWLEVRPVGLPALHPGSRLIVGDRIGRSIAPNGLYNICQAHLARCLVEKGFLDAPNPMATLDPGALAHMGPNTLRNTCIAMWFNAGVPLQEIQRRCGFKDASVMSRLGAHLLSPFPL